MWIAAATAVALWTGSAAQDDAAAKRAAAGLQSAVEAFLEGDCAKALPLAAALVDPAPSPALPPNILGLAYEIAARCAYQQRKAAQAAGYVQRGTALADAPDGLWDLRVEGEVWEGEPKAAVATLETLAAGRGRALNAVRSQTLFELQRRLKSDEATTLRLLRVVGDASFQPDDMVFDPHGARVELARALIKQGDRTQATAVLATVEGSDATLDAVLDPMLKPLLPKHPDLLAVAEAELIRDQQATQVHGDRLRGAIVVARDLRRLGRAAEAKAVLESARARFGDPDAFVDREDQEHWWWNALSETEAMLGQIDPAIAAMRQGAGLKEGGGPNVSQAINLAHLQLEGGRPADAAATLASMKRQDEGVTPYGRMMMRWVGGCAAHLLGRRDEATAAASGVLAGEKEAPHAVTSLELCRGGEDAAAASLIRRLSNPEWRRAALLKLADYAPPPSGAPAAVGAATLLVVRQRADVRAALAAAGGAPAIPLQAAEIN